MSKQNHNTLQILSNDIPSQIDTLAAVEEEEVDDEIESDENDTWDVDSWDEDGGDVNVQRNVSAFVHLLNKLKEAFPDSGPQSYSSKVHSLPQNQGHAILWLMKSERLK